MIEVENVVKKYDRLTVLKEVSISIPEGSITTIVGPSGAGKSTLLQIIGTLDTMDKGDVKVKGVSLKAKTPNELADFRNLNIGFVFQFHHLLPEFTALENVCIPAYIARKEEKVVIPKAQKILDRLGLKNRLHHKPTELSGGEKQRVAVARALINDPAVILADEPSGNLDTKNALELHRLFFDLKKEFNQTFVVVTHNESLAEEADQKITLVDGMVQDVVVLNRS